MTSGERMVWAEVFARRLEASTTAEPAPAARAACRAVQLMRALGVEGAWKRALNDDERAMLDEMIGVPR